MLDVDPFLFYAGNQELYKDLSNFYMVHIEDVANAHVFLFEYPNAKGRYICSSIQITIPAMLKFLSAKYPEFQIPAMK